jgi:threonine dehydrogenase-like Zn-dependent dehydrogenase
MRGAILHAAYDVRIENRDDPSIIEPTDAIIRLSATCVCGSERRRPVSGSVPV